ncbi:MAG TPA: glycosyltransferase family 2 protein [Tepidisphaeraceae bacterium]|jgi:glycosyltransferase involved in cell wall biosynthesis|nr:glycosyltransferase family 2 protein [Tepidisphaeraceae bacterium]
MDGPSLIEQKCRRSPSVLILTRNEEVNIAACLESCLAFSDDVVVLDSHSTDRTVEVAESYPAIRVIRRVFDTEWKHRNFGLHEIAYRNDWVYICDADERVTPALGEEIIDAISSAAPSVSAFRVRYMNMLRGHWIRFASGYPVWLIRLVRPPRVGYEVRETNVHPIVDGGIGELKRHFIHYSFNKGMVHWFTKHNFYSEMEARAAIKVTQGSIRPWLAALVDRDRGVRRRGLKNLSFFLPGRSVVRFFYVYLLRLGFLDGTAGLHYSAMISTYEYWIDMKVRELRNDWPGQVDRMVAERLQGQSAAPVRTPVVNVMIPTLNEADHIAQVVANALTLGPVFVLDSGSTDGTQGLARDAGATVVEHPFVNYSAQKNWGLDNIAFNAGWIFILDADERITPELRDEILATLRGGGKIDGYYVNRLPLFMGSAIRHGGMYPSWNLRLFRRGSCRYENRSVHEHMICTGPTAYLTGEMLHLRRESLTRYLAKHIKYADMESDEWIKRRRGQSQSAPAMDLFPGALGWRQWLRRNVLPILPASPIWRVLFMYVLRLGFLDGFAGWRLARLMGCYEYMIVLLYDEKVRQSRSDKSVIAANMPDSANGPNHVHRGE